MAAPKDGLLVLPNPEGYSRRIIHAQRLPSPPVSSAKFDMQKN